MTNQLQPKRIFFGYCRGIYNFPQLYVPLLLKQELMGNVISEDANRIKYFFFLVKQKIS